MIDLTINFGAVAVRSDPIFGCLVHSKNGWVPFSSGSQEEQEWVRRQIRYHQHKQMLTDGMRKAMFGEHNDR